VVTRVADMSVEELKTLIQGTIIQTLTELLHDPDAGLELREDFVMALRHSLETAQAEGKTFNADSVAAKLELSW